MVWSVVRIACAVVLTFCPVFSAATAARSAPSFAVLMASSALPIANWPNTPALSADAPMFSRLPTPLRIWLPRSPNRPPYDSTASGSMLVPLPGAIAGTPPEVDGDPPVDPPPLWVLVDELW
ncbi:hypothetical protein [Actinocrispum sp. NPDC049592]|uniref:hypothetical protein n=1 Tax=Actinocrispum sp. NPDC049592 TaxID=3154835 RepID=UPI00344644C5